MNKDNQNNQSTETPLGDGIQTLAATIALEVLENANNQTSPDQKDELKQMERRMR